MKEITITEIQSGGSLPHIIIQAGGRGLRLETFTTNKPKALIPVRGLPIIFHLFRQFRGADFTIIGDYKYEVLERYLSTFAKGVNYRMVRSRGKGNAAGIREAARQIADDKSVLLVWCDLVLADHFAVKEGIEGCQVGVVDFACSWRLRDGCLEKQPSAGGDGVAGLFFFPRAQSLLEAPEEGSFTRWLQGRTDIPLEPLPLKDCLDVGTAKAYKQIETTANRCRPYNCIELTADRVIKTALTPEAEKLIEREIRWYDWMEQHGFSAIPRMYAKHPLTLERIHGTNIFLSQLNEQQKADTLNRLIEAVTQMHSLASAPASMEDIRTEYFGKTIARLRGIESALPFAEHESIRINGRDCVNLLRHPERLENAVERTLTGIKAYCPIHGDCQLTNTLRDTDGNIFFIDARGYFGSSQVLGDPRYDWAKIYYAIIGNFDQFNVKNFTLEIGEHDVRFEIASGGWEFLSESFLRSIPPQEADLAQIQLIHAVIWLSMASHAWEDYDSMCVAFFHGLLLFHEWEEEYGK